PPVAAPAAGAADLAGEDVYNQACVACHGAGVAGAPKFGDVAAWAPRIAQGSETLNTHALQGFQGKGGFMPPKGGRTDLSDQSVINAVEYMVAAAK
ncbi:MAG: c-type cytochrome, partial [Steroidobacteraceae bacterium]